MRCRRELFDGTGSATGGEVSHRFRPPGAYKVVVGATSDANPTGASDIVTVLVGEAPEEGPDREGGGTNEAAGRARPRRAAAARAGRSQSSRSASR